jgi:septal ring factor EnvC (AmiA/AmiB activator)
MELVAAILSLAASGVGIIVLAWKYATQADRLATANENLAELARQSKWLSDENEKLHENIARKKNYIAVLEKKIVENLDAAALADAFAELFTPSETNDS